MELLPFEVDPFPVPLTRVSFHFVDRHPSLCTPPKAYLHVNAIMWRQVFRELRALTNDKTIKVNPLQLNDLYEHL